MNKNNRQSFKKSNLCINNALFDEDTQIAIRSLYGFYNLLIHFLYNLSSSDYAFILFYHSMNYTII